MLRKDRCEMAEGLLKYLVDEDRLCGYNFAVVTPDEEYVSSYGYRQKVGELLKADRNTIYDAQYEYAEKVLNGDVADEHFLALIYELDSSKEWTNPGTWVKANPGLGTIKSVKTLTENVEKANKKALEWYYNHKEYIKEKRHREYEERKNKRRKEGTTQDVL